jgi:imidazolonepropionase-like amidohydrolase
VAAEGAVEVVELPGCTLIPGLIDMHGHCRIDARSGPLRPQTQDEPAAYVLRSLANLQADLRAGVTTVKTNGDRDFLDVGLRDAIAAGLAEGPRLFVATRGIKAPDSTAGVVATALCRGPDAIREAVRENLAGGADHIKLYVSGGLLEPIEEACRAYYSYEEIRAAVDAAEAGGSYVVAHCAGGPSADWCAEAGVRVLEHGYYLTDEQLARLRERGTWLDLTLGVCFHPEGHVAEAIRHGADPAEMAERERQARDTARRAIAQGNRFVLGTDSLHGLLAYESEQAVALGARPVDALRALTAGAATVMGVGDRLGTLEAGKLADVVAVPGDPLGDIRALWRVEAVFMQGRQAPLK